MYIVETYIIEIVAALIGLSYPFIFQIIGRIDDKYHSVNMVRMFKQEPVFRIYNILLSITVILAIIIPFTKNPYCPDAPFQWQSFQAISLIILMCALGNLGLLLNLMWTYHIPMRLHNHLKGRIESNATKARRKIIRLKYGIRKLKININRAPRRWYYVSDSEIEQWKKSLDKKEKTLELLENIDTYNDVAYVCLADLLLFSIGGTDVELYLSCGTTFVWCREQCGIKEITVDKTIFFKEDKIARTILNTVNQVVQESINKASLNPSLTNPSNFLYFLFPQFRVATIQDEVYRCLWYNLTKFERYGKLEWIESFWEWIVQYANLWLSRSNKHDTSQILFRLQEFSDCLFAYLLSKGHYRLVLKMRRHSNSIPYINKLVPSRLSLCCEHLLELEKPFVAEIRYPFDSSGGVNVGETVKAWVKLYYLLSFVLFPKLKNDLKEDYFQEHEKIKLKNCISIISDMLIFIESLGSKSTDNLSNSFIIPPDISDNLKQAYLLSCRMYVRVVMTLKSILTSLERRLKELRQEEVIPSENKKAFENEIINSIKAFISKEQWPWIPGLAEDISQILEMPPITITADYFSNHREIGYVNFPETVQGMYLRYIAERYEREFLLNSAVRSYVVDFSEINLALQRLELNDTFSIICLGVDKSLIRISGVSNIFSMISQRGIIIIMKSADVPKLKYNPDNIISFNFTEIKTKDGRNEIIKGSVNIDIESSKHPMRYIQLIPAWLEYSGRQSQLSDIQIISKYIV